MPPSRERLLRRRAPPRACQAPAGAL